MRDAESLAISGAVVPGSSSRTSSRGLRASPGSSATEMRAAGRRGYSQPFSSATRTASARLRASSFCIAEERWLRTVPGER